MAGMTTRWGALRMFGLAAGSAATGWTEHRDARRGDSPDGPRDRPWWYRGASIGTLGLMGLAAAYVVSPADLVPEVFFGLFGVMTRSSSPGSPRPLSPPPRTSSPGESGADSGRNGAGRPGAAPQGCSAPAPGATETVRSHVVVARGRPQGRPLVPLSTGRRSAVVERLVGIPTIVGIPTTIRVRSLPELLTILPYQLGFRPSTCVVLAGIGDRLGPIARVDLPPAGYGEQVAIYAAPPGPTARSRRPAARRL